MHKKDQQALTLPPDISRLLAAAQLAQSRAYAPYSNFQVGAAILAENGQIYAGCNVENVSYPLGQCAEATAIGTMVASGAKQIKQILILSPNNQLCPPCGGCRQKIKEMANMDTQVHLVSANGQQQSLSFSELLPLAFDKNT